MIAAQAQKREVDGPWQTDEVRHGEKLAVLSLTLVIIAAFGPYTSIAGTRTEQWAVYGCLAVPLAVSWMRIRLTEAGRAFLVLWGIYVGVAAFQALLWEGTTSAPPGQLLGGADNLLRPAAVFLLVNLWMVTTVDREWLLRLACKLVVGAMCVNSILAFAESRVDITEWLSPFWSSLTSDVLSGTVAGRASQLGRFTGLLNQPVEAGTLYAIAVFAALYLWHRRPGRLVAVLLVLVAGGVFTVSKIFLFGALPIAIWQLFTLRGPRRMRLALVGLSLIAAFAALNAGLVPQWSGSELLGRLAAPNGNYLTFFTAGRLGGDTFLTELIGEVLSRSPLAGFGLRGLTTAYDNGWVQALVFAGLIGATVYTAVLLILVQAWWMRRRLVTPAESKFAGSLILLAIGASFGFPVLTGNRVATVLWVLLSLALLVRLQPPSPSSARSPFTGAGEPPLNIGRRAGLFDRLVKP